jgi:raffinose/stachyose/melibiose transport system permease protein
MFLLLLGPGLLWYTFVVLLPIGSALKFSFFRWSGGDAMKFIGLSNYTRLIADELFWFSLKNNLMIGGLSVIGQIGIALILSTLLTSRIVRWKSFHRSVVFFPVVLAPVIIGFIWSLIYSKDYGLLNLFLRVLGLDLLVKPWLDDPSIVIYSLTAPIIWQYIGYYVVILSSGISSIPKEVFESAELDGATGWRKLIHIIYPLIRETILVCVMLCIAGSMKIFAHILVMTGGGPGNSSMVMAMYAYNNSFVKYRLGYGSASSIGILIVSLTIIIVTRKLMKRGQHEY